MFKNRTFLMGLGIGLIAGAILLQLSLIGSNAEQLSRQSESNKGSMTLAELEKGAAELGIMVMPKGSKIYTQTELDAKLKEQETKLKAETSASQQNDAPTNTNRTTDAEQVTSDDAAEVGQATASSANAANESSTSNSSADADSASSANQLTLTITKGMSFTDVAKKLQQLGVIVSASDFVKHARDKGAVAKIQTGTYSFTGKTTYYDILLKMTAKS